MLLALRLRRYATCSSVVAVLFGAGSILVAQTPDTLSRLSGEGAKALSEHRYADAERAYEQLRDLSPGVAEVHANLGVIYFQQGKFALAVASLRQALKLKPSLPNVSVLLAMSLSELGRFEEAMPGLERGFKQTADTVLRRAAGLQLQRAYTGLSRHAEAVNVAWQLAQLYPKDPEILYQASRLYANFAYVTLLNLAEVAPDSLWVHLAAGEADESQGLYDAALKEYRAALAIDPRRSGIHFRLGRVLLARAEHDTNGADSEAEALKEFAEELRHDPTNANAAYEIAEIHRKAGNLGSARTFFETALKHYPDFEEALVGLGRSLIALQEPKLALVYLGKAIALNSKSEIAYYQLAQAHRALGDTAAQEKALTVFEQLRSASERAPSAATPSRPEVTKQKLDPKSPGTSLR
jgi:tetratricopeptide (TPR) repeat protein